jgi:hypothetical protein
LIDGKSSIVVVVPRKNWIPACGKEVLIRKSLQSLYKTTRCCCCLCLEICSFEAPPSLERIWGVFKWLGRSRQGPRGVVLMMMMMILLTPSLTPPQTSTPNKKMVGTHFLSLFSIFFSKLLVSNICFIAFGFEICQV